MRRHFLAVCLALVSAACLGGAKTSFADSLLISSPPVVSADDMQAMFKPIAALLSEKLGLIFNFETPKHQRDYALKLRAGRFDIVFDEAHVIAKLIANSDYTPLLALSGKSAFAIVSRYADEEIVTLADLEGQKICADAEPSLQATILSAQFRDSYRAPLISPVGYRYQSLMDNRCDASMMLAENYLPKLHQESPRVTRILYFIAELPRRAFAISPDIPAIVRTEMINALLSREGFEASEALRKHFNSKHGFGSVTAAGYADLQKLIAPEQSLLGQTLLTDTLSTD